MKQLNDKERAVVKAYVSNGFNKGRAYGSVYPDCTEESARVLGSKMLNQPHMQLAIEEYGNKEVASLKDSKEKIIHEAIEITQLAKDKHQYSAALKGLDTRSKLGGYYDQDAESSEKYIAFIQQINNTTQINMNNSVNRPSRKQEDNQVSTLRGVTLHDESKVIDIDNPYDNDRDDQYMTEVG